MNALRLLAIPFAISVALTLVCFTHAVLSRPRVSPSNDPNAFAQLPLSPHDDLRHPSWARPDMSRVGQPLLPDPRLPALLLRPIPFEVQP